MADFSASFAVETTRHQLVAIANGLDLDAQPIAAMMSGRAMFAHLYECYCAALTILGGREHPWGDFEIPQSVMESPVAETFAKREEAVAALLADGSEAALKIAIDYIALHDSYHIGQLCTLRLTVDPEWDFYSIYKH